MYTLSKFRIIHSTYFDLHILIKTEKEGNA